jgi:hypothetical protein
MPLVKIMHIDPDYRVFLMVLDKGCSRVSNLPLREALELMRNQEVDLIVSEPQNMAILNKNIAPNPTINRGFSSVQ